MCLFGCQSLTTGTNTPWGPINGVNFVPADAFFVESVQLNGDYSLVLIVADRTGYCPILQQNLSGYPSNITIANFTFSNPIGTGSVDPGPGTYPVTASYGNASSAQVAYQTVLQLHRIQPPGRQQRQRRHVRPGQRRQQPCPATSTSVSAARAR